jgi:2'-5' RNA ligase
MLRLFAALALPDDIAQALAARQTGLAGARWSPPGQLHVTLRFFGEIPRVEAADLDAELAGVEGDPITLTLEGVGTFGEAAEIRVLWAGVVENAPLRRLAARCESAARRAGLTPDKRVYSPHVTLAYLRRPDPGRVAAWVQTHNLLKSPEFQVAEFGLYSSWPTPEGARYALERSYPLLG